MTINLAAKKQLNITLFFFFQNNISHTYQLKKYMKLIMLTLNNKHPFNILLDELLKTFRLMLHELKIGIIYNVKILFSN